MARADISTQKSIGYTHASKIAKNIGSITNLSYIL